MEVFLTGECPGRKADPCNVSKAMRKATNPDGTYIFDASSYLTSQQVASFFSRLAAKKNVQAESDDSQDNPDEEMKIIQEEIEQDLTRKVMDEISIQYPLMYANHSICELAAASKLSKFSVQMLSDICKSFKLDVSSPTIKRKKPYIDLLTD